MLRSFWEYFQYIWKHFREPFNIILEPFQKYVGTILKTCFRPSYDHFGIVCIMLVTFRNHYRTILGPVYGHVIPTYKAFLDMCSHLENILGICLSFWGNGGNMCWSILVPFLGSFSDHCKDILKLSKEHYIFVGCWPNASLDSLRVILGTSYKYAGTILKSFLDNVSDHFWAIISFLHCLKDVGIVLDTFRYYFRHMFVLCSRNSCTCFEICRNRFSNSLRAC